MLTNKEQKWKEITGGRHLLIKGKGTLKYEVQPLGPWKPESWNCFGQAFHGLCMQSSSTVNYHMNNTAM